MEICYIYVQNIVCIYIIIEKKSCIVFVERKFQNQYKYNNVNFKVISFFLYKTNCTKKIIETCVDADIRRCGVVIKDILAQQTVNKHVSCVRGVYEVGLIYLYVNGGL